MALFGTLCSPTCVLSFILRLKIWLSQTVKKRGSLGGVDLNCQIWILKTDVSQIFEKQRLTLTQKADSNGDYHYLVYFHLYRTWSLSTPTRSQGWSTVQVPSLRTSGRVMVSPTWHLTGKMMRSRLSLMRQRTYQRRSTDLWMKALRTMRVY